MTFADRVPRYLRFSQYWGTFFIFVFIICCICNYFISSVPRYFILSNFRGTFLISTYNMRLNFYSFSWLCTPIFHNFKMSGYARPNFNLFYTTYSLYSLKMYPDISFFLFFEVHILKLPLFCTTYSLYSSKTYPGISFFLFFEVHIPQLLLILHNIWFVPTKKRTQTFLLSFF